MSAEKPFKKRMYRVFTEEEKKIIKEKNGLITLNELGILLKLNYTNLSGGLKQNKVAFTPKKKVANIRPDVKATMSKKYNDEGEEIVTDELMKIWSYSNNQV